MRSRVEFAAVLVTLVIGAGVVLLCASRSWQTITTPRPRPFADDVLAVSGRTIDSASTALGLVALAGVVAVIATRGIARRIVGVLVAIAGAALIWRGSNSIGAVSQARARALVHGKHPHVVQSGTAVHVVTHPAWGALSIIGAVLVLISGVVIAVRGARWGAMSARYESPTKAADSDPEQARARADASLWTALERGEDPTAHDPHESR
jgi:uncharacterized membrane protein (TIGR02234 family)